MLSLCNNDLETARFVKERAPHFFRPYKRSLSIAAYDFLASLSLTPLPVLLKNYTQYYVCQAGGPCRAAAADADPVYEGNRVVDVRRVQPSGPHDSRSVQRTRSPASLESVLSR